MTFYFREVKVRGFKRWCFYRPPSTNSKRLGNSEPDWQGGGRKERQYGKIRQTNSEFLKVPKQKLVKTFASEIRTMQNFFYRYCIFTPKLLNHSTTAIIKKLFSSNFLFSLFLLMSLSNLTYIFPSSFSLCLYHCLCLCLHLSLILFPVFFIQSKDFLFSTNQSCSLYVC